MSDLAAQRERVNRALRTNPGYVGTSQMLHEYMDTLEAEVERLGARVTEEARLRNHWRGKAEQFRGKVERLRVAIIEWADSRTRTYGFSSDEEVAQRDADEALLAIDRALAGEGDDAS